MDCEFRVQRYYDSVDAPHLGDAHWRDFDCDGGQGDAIAGGSRGETMVRWITWIGLCAVSCWSVDTTVSCSSVDGSDTPGTSDGVGWSAAGIR